MAEKLSAETVQAVEAEVIRAHGIHQPHSMLYPEMGNAERVAILGEEFGEVCRELTYDHFNPAGRGLKKELIQLAAMALSWAEVL